MEFGSLQCRELIGFDLSDPEQGHQAAEAFKTLCPRYIDGAIKILTRLVNE